MILPKFRLEAMVKYNFEIKNEQEIVEKFSKELYKYYSISDLRKNINLSDIVAACSEVGKMKLEISEEKLYDNSFRVSLKAFEGLWNEYFNEKFDFNNYLYIFNHVVKYRDEEAYK